MTLKAKIRKAIRVAADDNRQMMLSPTSTLGIKRREPPIVVSGRIYTGPFFCPYCLDIGRLGEFRVQVKRGWSQKMAKCPECNQRMRMTTLTKDMTPEDYADWVFQMSFSGFWQRVDFYEWNRRLRLLGWSYRFWQRYKQLKGEQGLEAQIKEMERQQKEWAEEEGLV